MEMAVQKYSKLGAVVVRLQLAIQEYYTQVAQSRKHNQSVHTILSKPQLLALVEVL